MWVFAWEVSLAGLTVIFREGPDETSSVDLTPPNTIQRMHPPPLSRVGFRAVDPRHSSICVHFSQKCSKQNV